MGKKRAPKGLKTKYYVIQEIGWCYNDSTYDRASDNQCSTRTAGEAKLVYRSFATARDACKRMNDEKYREQVASGYPMREYKWARDDESGPYPEIKEFFEVIGVELGPEEVETPDATAAALAAAVQAGDKSAIDPLVDRLLELRGGG